MRVGLLQRGQTTCTLLIWIGTGRSRIPPCWVRCRERGWRLAMLMPGTTTPRPRFVRSTRSTVPRLPRSLPARTSTVSPLRTFIGLQHLRRERHDLHVIALPQLAGDRAEDARPAWVPLWGDEHRRVLVEADVASVGPAVLLRGADHHGTDDIALLDPRVGERLLHAGDDHVADVRGARCRAPDDGDALQRPRAGVVGDAQPAVLADHASSDTPTSSSAEALTSSSPEPRATTST